MTVIQKSLASDIIYPSSSSTWTDILSISVNPGLWFVQGQGTYRENAGVINMRRWRLFDGTNVYSEIGQNHNAAAGLTRLFNSPLINAVISTTGTTDLKLQTSGAGLFGTYTIRYNAHDIATSIETAPLTNIQAMDITGATYQESRIRLGIDAEKVIPISAVGQREVIRISCTPGTWFVSGTVGWYHNTANNRKDIFIFDLWDGQYGYSFFEHAIEDRLLVFHTVNLAAEIKLSSTTNILLRAAPEDALSTGMRINMAHLVGIKL